MDAHRGQIIKVMRLTALRLVAGATARRPSFTGTSQQNGQHLSGRNSRLVVLFKNSTCALRKMDNDQFF